MKILVWHNISIYPYVNLRKHFLSSCEIKLSIHTEKKKLIFFFLLKVVTPRFMTLYIYMPFYIQQSSGYGIPYINSCYLADLCKSCLHSGKKKKKNVLVSYCGSYYVSNAKSKEISIPIYAKECTT